MGERPLHDGAVGHHGHVRPHAGNGGRAEGNRVLAVRDLADEITGGHWRPGERIPSEHALCDHFGLSRTTVRQALGSLKQEGLLRADAPIPS